MYKTFDIFWLMLKRNTTMNLQKVLHFSRAKMRKCYPIKFKYNILIILTNHYILLHLESLIRIKTNDFIIVIFCNFIQIYNCNTNKSMILYAIIIDFDNDSCWQKIWLHYCISWMLFKRNLNTCIEMRMKFMSDCKTH